MRFQSRFFSYLLITSFLLSHGLAEYSHQLYHATRGESCLDNELPLTGGPMANHQDSCPIEKIIKSIATESVHFVASAENLNSPLYDLCEPRIPSSKFSIAAYCAEFTRGPPQG